MCIGCHNTIQECFEHDTKHSLKMLRMAQKDKKRMDDKDAIDTQHIELELQGVSIVAGAADTFCIEKEHKMDENSPNEQVMSHEDKIRFDHLLQSLEMNGYFRGFVVYVNVCIAKRATFGGEWSLAFQKMKKTLNDIKDNKILTTATTIHEREEYYDKILYSYDMIVHDTINYKHLADLNGPKNELIGADGNNNVNIYLTVISVMVDIDSSILFNIMAGLLISQVFFCGMYFVLFLHCILKTQTRQFFVFLFFFFI